MRRLALAGAALALVGGGVAAAAKPRTGKATGLHNARYCEIIELKGLPPHGVATVWNTITLNKCPEAKWRTFDAGALAKERHDTAVVLNGPRYFLMDSAAAVVGARHSFHGLNTTKVATLPIRTAADLVQTPYNDRIVVRDNYWRWNKGRTLFELVAPGGDVYVMQAYSQIKDPKLSYGDLPTLGRRLALPPGWRYRLRKTHRPYVMDVRHSATILQDELQDTYQLATPAPRGKRASHAVKVSGHTKNVKRTAAGDVIDRGTLTGTPFGAGRIELTGTLKAGRLTASYRLTFARGSIIGKVDMPLSVSGSTVTFQGTTRFTAGTGAYRDIRSGSLAVKDTNTFDGQHGVLSVTGRASYRSAR